jgi:hypothetical protein
MRKTSLAVLLPAAMAGPALPTDAEAVGVDIEKTGRRRRVRL